MQRLECGVGRFSSNLWLLNTHTLAPGAAVPPFSDGLYASIIPCNNLFVNNAVLGRQVAAAQHRDAAAQVLQPPVPLPGRGARAPLLHGRPPRRERRYVTHPWLLRTSPRVVPCSTSIVSTFCRQDGAAGHAAAQAAAAGLARPHLLPDDAPPRHPGGLLHLPPVQVLPHRR